MSRKPVDVHALRDGEVRAVATLLRRLVQLQPDAVRTATERTVAGAFERELELQDEIAARNAAIDAERERERRERLVQQDTDEGDNSCGQ